MPRRIRRAAIALLIVAALAQLIRPPRTNPVADPASSLSAMRPVPAHVADVLDRACRDCHSNDTRWPWYSHVAPVSWFVIDHVDHGRSHFNYSEWNRYSQADAESLLERVCKLARLGTMPLPSYTWMHGRARLSPGDVAALCSWTSGGQILN